MHRVHRRAVELCGAFGARLRDPADDLRHVLRRPVHTARIDPLRRERQVEVLTHLEPGRFEPRQHLFSGRPGIRRRLEHDEMSLAQPFRDLLRGCVHDREVRLALLRERRRQRDQDRVSIAQLVVVGGRTQEVSVDEALQHLRRDVLDVALAPVQLRNTSGVALDEEHAAARLGEHLGKRDADVAGSDNGNVGHRRGIVQRWAVATGYNPPPRAVSSAGRAGDS